MRLIIAGTRGLGCITHHYTTPFVQRIHRQNEHWDALIAHAAKDTGLDLSRVSQVISGHCLSSPDEAGETWACYEYHRREESQGRTFSNRRKKSFIHAEHTIEQGTPAPLVQNPQHFLLKFPANWKGPLKKGAGFARNIDMAIYAATADHDPDAFPPGLDPSETPALLAIWDGISTGTEHMIETATEYSLDLYIHITTPEEANDQDRFELKTPREPIILEPDTHQPKIKTSAGKE